MMTGFERYTKKTRRAMFLEEMEQVVPWAKLCVLIEPHYPKPGNGRRPKELEQMLRIYFLQQWFNLSDPAVEEALYDSATLRQFAGIDLGSGPVPDETTVCKFRHLLEAHNSGRRDCGQGEPALASQGSTDHDGYDRGRDSDPRAQFDQEPRAEPGPGDASDEEGEELVLRDEGARGRGQQDENHSHGGGDAAAHVSDVAMLPELLHGEETRVWGRRRSVSGPNRGDPRVRAPEAQDFTQRRCRYKGQVVDEVAWAKNRTKSKVRAKVEHVFQVMKLQFGFVKVRYRGLKKNAHRLFVTCALVNLFVSRKKLLAAA